MLSTSTGQGDGSPITFYERYGSEQAGEIVFDDEVLLRLKLRYIRLRCGRDARIVTVSHTARRTWVSL